MWSLNGQVGWSFVASIVFLRKSSSCGWSPSHLCFCRITEGELMIFVGYVSYRSSWWRIDSKTPRLSKLVFSERGLNKGDKYDHNSSGTCTEFAAIGCLGTVWHWDWEYCEHHSSPPDHWTILNQSQMVCVNRRSTGSYVTEVGLPTFEGPTMIFQFILPAFILESIASWEAENRWLDWIEATWH
jgi:hypothetical protein